MSGKLMVDAQVWDAQNKALRNYEDDIKRLAKENEQLESDITQRKFMANVKTGFTLEGVIDRAEKAESERDRLGYSLHKVHESLELMELAGAFKGNAIDQKIIKQEIQQIAATLYSVGAMK